MSRHIPPKCNKKEQQLQMINGAVHMHDMGCGCDSPLEHLTLSIFNQEKNLRFTDEEKKFLRKCLGSTEETTIAEDHFGEGDLEDLFAEDFGEERKSTATVSDLG